MDDRVDISIVICTYNRADLLSRLLSDMEIQNDNFEKISLIVVNNNSNDNTAEVVESFSGVLPIAEVLEPKQGLSYARNRGINASAGDIVIFIDDDMRIDESWLSGFRKAFLDFPQYDYFGAKIKPYWPDGKPGWVKDENMSLLSGVFGNLDLGNASRIIRNGDDGPFGGCFAVRRRLFDAIGNFNCDLGRKEQKLGRGEESEFFQRARREGKEGIYIAESQCRHRVDNERLTLKALWKYGVESGIAQNKIYGSGPPANWIIKVIMNLLKGVFQLVKGRGDRFRQCIINAGIVTGMVNAG